MMRISPFLATLFLSGSVFATTLETTTLDIQNMTCAACPITVKKALQQVPGVSHVSIDVKTRSATLQRDTSKANIAMLTKATTDAGYPSTVRK